MLVTRKGLSTVQVINERGGRRGRDEQAYYSGDRQDDGRTRRDREKGTGADDQRVDRSPQASPHDDLPDAQLASSPPDGLSGRGGCLSSRAQADRTGGACG